MQDPHKIIEQLSLADARAVLRTLAREDERLATRIAEIATARLSHVDPEALAFGLYDELEMLEVEDVWYRAGPSRQGYVDPTEASAQMIDAVIEPYRAELKKYHALGMNAQANQVCMGLLWGLYQFEYASESEFKNWAVDAPESFAWDVLDTWKEGSPSQSDRQALRAFIQDRLGGWSARYL